MGFFLSLVFGFVPMFLFAWLIFWLDRYEKEPLRLLGGVFIWGAIFAAGAAFVINTILGMGVYLFTGSETATDLSTGSIIAPLVEESLKGLAVLLVFILFRREFDSVLDGIVYAAIAALGFAATENVLYIYRDGFLEKGYQGLLWMVFVRVILVGWQHPFYTAFTGIGLALARLSRSIFPKLLFPLLGWSASVFTHSVHNLLASLPNQYLCVLGTFLDWGGWLMMLLFILWAIRREGKFVSTYLAEEVKTGLISPAQYQIACSSWAQSSAGISAMIAGRYRHTRRFYQLCGELAHKKYQRLKFGEEGGNSAIIDGLRQELATLNPLVI